MMLFLDRAIALPIADAVSPAIHISRSCASSNSHHGFSILPRGSSIIFILIIDFGTKQVRVNVSLEPADDDTQNGTDRSADEREQDRHGGYSTL